MGAQSNFEPRLTDTRRLYLTNFTVRDGNFWLEIVCNSEIARFVPGVYPLSEEECYFNIICYQNENGKGDYYIAVKTWDQRLEEEHGTLIGAIIATRPRDPGDEQTLEVAFLLGKNFRGKGYMIEALRTFIQIVKENPKVKELKFDVHSDNVRSINIIRKLEAQFKRMTFEPDYQRKMCKYVLNLNQI